MATYRYQIGDSPTSIAQNFGIDPQDLLNANPYATPFTVGQKIRIPRAPITAWDAMNPEQRSQLTPQARGLLAKTPYSVVPNLRYRGMEVGGGWSQLFPGTTGRIVINSKVADKPWLNLHEALHALDANTGRPSDSMQFSQETRKQMVDRYYSSYGNGYRGGNFGNESHIPQREAFAAGGQLGPGGVPPEMAKYYSGIFGPGVTPPEPDFGANFSDAGASVQLPPAPPKTTPNLSAYARAMNARAQTQSKTQPAPFMTMADRMAGYLGPGGTGTSLSPETQEQSSDDPFHNLSPGAQQYYIRRYLKHRARNAASTQDAGQASTAPSGYGLIDWNTSTG